MSIWNKGAGRTQQLTRGSSQSTVMLSESFIDERHEPRASVYTLQFSRRAVDGSVPDDQNPTVTYATITWTIGGVQTQRMISVANGQSLTGCGEGCTVSVIDDTDVLPNVPDTAPNYIVSVTLTPGSRGNNGNPPSYFTNDFTPQPSGLEVFGGGSAGKLAVSGGGGDNEVVIDVPKQAGVVSVQVTTGSADGSATDVRIAQTDALEKNIKVFNNQDFPDFVPVDPRAVQIAITNMSSTVECYWGICFGIDG